MSGVRLSGVVIEWSSVRPRGGSNALVSDSVSAPHPAGHPRTRAVEATDNGLLVPELAAGHRPREGREVDRCARGELAFAPPGAIHSRTRRDVTTTKALHARAIIAALLCVLRRSAAAALTDGRPSCAFTPAATAAAWHADTPELVCVVTRRMASAICHRALVRLAGPPRNWPPVQCATGGLNVS